MSDNMTSVLIVAICVLPWAFRPMIRMWRRPAAAMSAQEMAAIDQMAQVAARLEQRVITLERILDAEAPNWRSRAPEAGGMMGDRI